MSEPKSDGKKNVLIVLSVMGQFPEMFRIAQLLKSTETFNPILYFNLSVSLDHANVVHCLNQGIDIYDYAKGHFIGNTASLLRTVNLKTDTVVVEVPAVLYQPSKSGFKQYFKLNYPIVFEFLKRIYYFRLRFQLPTFIIRMIYMKNRQLREAQILNQLNARLLIFAEDSVDYFTPLLIRLGHERGIKSVVFPYTFANQYEFLEDAFFNDRRVNRGLLNYLAGSIFPKWTYVYKGKKLLKSLPSLIFSAELFKISPPNPWVMSSGFSDVVAVESQYMKSYYEKAGIPAAKMVEAGYPSLDFLSLIHRNKATYKEELSKRINLNSAKPIIVCAVAPTQWPRPATGFDSYSEFLDAFFGFLQPFENFEFVFKFHPRLVEDEIRPICEKYNIAYVPDDTAQLIAIADMYIASVSSTLRWALALGLPTINYDVYNYGYGDFDGSKNYTSVANFESFQKAFIEHSPKLKVNDPALQLQPSFGQLDNGANDRILKLFGSLTNEISFKI